MNDHISLSKFVFHPEVRTEFTRKEITVIHYSLCDYSVKEIADILHIHIDGIYKHRERIVEKSPVHSFEALLAWVLIEGIFTVDKNVP